MKCDLMFEFREYGIVMSPEQQQQILDILFGLDVMPGFNFRNSPEVAWRSKEIILPDEDNTKMIMIITTRTFEDGKVDTSVTMTLNNYYGGLIQFFDDKLKVARIPGIGVYLCNENEYLFYGQEAIDNLDNSEYCLEIEKFKTKGIVPDATFDLYTIGKEINRAIKTMIDIKKNKISM